MESVGVGWGEKQEGIDNHTILRQEPLEISDNVEIRPSGSVPFTNKDGAFTS